MATEEEMNSIAPVGRGFFGTRPFSIHLESPLMKCAKRMRPWSGNAVTEALRAYANSEKNEKYSDNQADDMIRKEDVV